MSNELYIYIDLDKLSDLRDHPTVAARKIIDAAFLGGVPKEDDRALYDEKGRQCGYLGSRDLEKEETDNAKNYRIERERNAVLKAENKGLKEALKEAVRPTDELIEGLRSQLATADRHARLALKALNGQ